VDFDWDRASRLAARAATLSFCGDWAELRLGMWIGELPLRFRVGVDEECEDFKGLRAMLRGFTLEFEKRDGACELVAKGNSFGCEPRREEEPATGAGQANARGAPGHEPRSR